MAISFFQNTEFVKEKKYMLSSEAYRRNHYKVENNQKIIEISKNEHFQISYLILL